MTSEELQEYGFAMWCRDTLFPEAVCRWVSKIGANVPHHVPACLNDRKHDVKGRPHGAAK